MSDTLLVIEGMGVPLYSARDLEEVFGLIEGASQLERSCNGLPINFAPDWSKLWTLTLTCTDVRALVPDNIWPGDEVTVSCVTEFSYPSGGSPARTPVPGSERTEGDRVFYRPMLEMTVWDTSGLSTNENTADVAWTLVLQETGDSDETI